MLDLQNEICQVALRLVQGGEHGVVSRTVGVGVSGAVGLVEPRISLVVIQRSHELEIGFIVSVVRQDCQWVVYPCKGVAVSGPKLVCKQVDPSPLGIET